MEKIPFTPTIYGNIQKQIEKAIDENKSPYYAAFDADGTLWDSDLGEQFFQYQIDHCDLPTLKGTDPWHYYNSTKEVDPKKAYLWLAQINQGQLILNVRKWAKEAVRKGGVRVFQSQKKLIQWLQSMGVEVFIVTASIQWAVEPASQLVGVPSQNVLGIQTHIDSKGLITHQQGGPITWREGKAKALLERTGGIPPIFCSGNTYGDIALLEASVGTRLCIQTQTENNSLFEEERKLHEHAKQKNWMIHHFFKV